MSTSASPYQVYRLDDVATIERRTVQPGDIIAGTNYVGLEHIDSDGQFVGVRKVNPGELASNKFSFGPNHLLFGKLRPYLRKTARPDFQGICSTDIVPILPGPRVDRNFLFHFLRHPKTVEQAVLRCAGANLPRLSPRDLGSFEVPLPPMSEQRRVADVLDKSDGIRRKRKEAIALTEELLRSAFLEMFGDPVTNTKGWPVKQLGELADAASGVTKGKRYNGQAMVTVPYMRVANVQDGHLNLNEVKTITVSEEDGRRYQLMEGDVLLTEGGDPDKLGRGTVWRGEIHGSIHQNHIFRVRPGGQLRSDYLSAIISSERGKRYFLRAAKQTTGIATINMTQLKAFPVLVPPFSVQESYAKFVARASAARSTLLKRHDLVEDLFESLMVRAFSGQLNGLAH